MRAISTSRTNQIVSLLQRGQSASAVARRVGVSKSTVAKYRAIHFPGAVQGQGGRAPKLTTRDKAILRRKIILGEWESAADAHRQLVSEGRQVTRKTVSRALESMGFKAKKKFKKHLITAKNRKARLRWARAYEHWTVDDWKRVVFSDETKINIWGSNGCTYYWTQPDSPLRANHINVTVKHGGGSLMMWGCMAYRGVGYGCHIQETMDSALYCEILSTSLKDTIEFWGLKNDGFIFQQDNDPKHKSKRATEWFTKEGIEVLPWPANSPDLNPIEHLWHHLKIKLALYENKARSIHELWERCDREWNSFTPELCNKYIESMPSRIKAVIKARGGHTRY